jgi:hypothetical protein
MICQPGEMKPPKQVPADFRDRIKARTFDIGAEMALQPDSPQVGKAGSVQRASLAGVLIFKRDKTPVGRLDGFADIRCAGHQELSTALESAQT